MDRPEKYHVVVVDDDPNICDVLLDALMENGYRAFAVADGRSMWRLLKNEKCDLLIMDLYLNKESGLQLAREVRQGSTMPIIMLTGKGDETDRILGLEVAADDFLMKPFNVRELLARVHALIRRCTTLNQPIHFSKADDHEYLLFGNWILDLTIRELKDRSGKRVDLTFGEYTLLEVLLKAPDRVFSRDQLLESTRSCENDVFDRTIDVLILRLRRKIEPNPKKPALILTERGMGYFLAGPVIRK